MVVIGLSEGEREDRKRRQKRGALQVTKDEERREMPTKRESAVFSCKNNYSRLENEQEREKEIARNNS
jgi:hypothetical protein